MEKDILTPHLLFGLYRDKPNFQKQRKILLVKFSIPLPLKIT